MSHLNAGGIVEWADIKKPYSPYPSLIPYTLTFFPYVFPAFVQKNKQQRKKSTTSRILDRDWTRTNGTHQSI